MSKNEIVPRKSVESLVINWHITEVCNYKCEYCYAKWNQKELPRELLHNDQDSEHLLFQLYEYFKPGNKKNPLSQALEWKSLRLNIAGGEPTIYHKKLMYIVRVAKKIGFEVSIITNGSQFKDLNFVGELASEISTLGVSIDSIDVESNKMIGRHNKDDEQLSKNIICNAIEHARKINPNIKIKFNSVINHANYRNDMNNFMKELRPDKWKVLRMLPIINNSLSVTDEEFSMFVKCHESQLGCMVIEDNQDMIGSYIMIDPQGRFFQNTEKDVNEDYSYSPYILDVGVARAFESIGFSEEKFSSRYILDGYS